MPIYRYQLMNIKNFTSDALIVFKKTIEDYHIYDDVKQVEINPYQQDDIAHLLYHKCWIDTVQWHLEDLIRMPDISDKRGMEIKRLIDHSNQERTNTVELLDMHFYHVFKEIKSKKNAYLNTETPAWAIDRFSILVLRIYHMKEQTNREDASEEHKEHCRIKLDILIKQKHQLMKAIDHLFDYISKGKIIFRPFMQMKMYNDKKLNPALYSSGKS